MLKENQIEDLHLYLNMICDIINSVFNKMEETFQSNTLDWSSLVKVCRQSRKTFLFLFCFFFFFIILFYFSLPPTCVSRFLRYFSTNLADIWHVDST